MPTEQSDSRTPNIPTRKRIAARVKWYHEVVAAHERGEHHTSKRGCVRCRPMGESK